MARKPEFVRSNVVDAALNVFWTNGYEASSISKLLEAMELNRGSLYGAFGDKESLFREVMSYYAEVITNLVTETLLSIDDPLQAIESFFHFMLLDNEADAGKGCLLFNIITELNNTFSELPGKEFC